MGVGIRTRDLRKIYNKLPPLAAAGARFGGGQRRKGKKTEIVALDGLSLNILPGEIFGLLGPNGAGKTTTVGILTTRVKPTSGDAWIGDHHVWKNQVTTKRLIGVVPQRPNLDFALTGKEILLFHGAYFGLTRAQRRQRAAELLDRFQLTQRADENVRGFSGGMMQRLSIARAMMHDPEVLFLDEPSSGLDPQTRLLLWEIIREYQARGKTIVITTHNMEEADALCHRIAIVDHGRVIAMGTPAELKASVQGAYLLRVRFTKVAPGMVYRLRELAGVSEAQLQGETANIYADRGGALLSALVAAACAEGVDICDVQISEPSLETLFLYHTGRSLRQ